MLRILSYRIHITPILYHKFAQIQVHRQNFYVFADKIPAAQSVFRTFRNNILFFNHMEEIKMNVLVVNAGSSSLKYQLFDTSTEKVLAKGICERIGDGGVFTHKLPEKPELNV